MNLAEWAKHLNRQAETQKVRMHAAIVESGKLVEETAKENIGHLQPEKGPFEAWKPLAPSTIEDKRRLGFDGSDHYKPLYRTGKMKASIDLVVFGNGFVVGSRDPVAGYQEFGTSRMPARPFIQPAMFTSLPAIHKIFGRVVVESVMPNPKGVRRRV